MAMCGRQIIGAIVAPPVFPVGVSMLYRAWKLLVLFLIVGGAAAVCACGDRVKAKTDKETSKPREELVNGLTSEQATKVVARVGEQNITVGDVTEQINRLSPYIKRRWATPEKRKEFLQKLIQIELLSQEAIREGLDKSPEVQRAVKQVMVRLMVKNDLENELFPTSVDEDRLKAEYDKEWQKYHSPAQHRMVQIVVETAEEADRLLEELKASPSPRERFRELARTVSIDEESRVRAGDIGYISNPEDIAASQKGDKAHWFSQTPGISEAVARASWTLKKANDLYPQPVRTDRGYHLLMLSTVKPALNRSFNSVKRLIENQVLREMRRVKMDEFVATLRAKADVKIYPENFDKVKLALPREGEINSATMPKEPDEVDSPQTVRDEADE
jgi:peptidyl-prolyl cis-trans isomerase C